MAISRLCLITALNSFSVKLFVVVQTPGKRGVNQDQFQGLLKLNFPLTEHQLEYFREIRGPMRRQTVRIVLVRELREDLLGNPTQDALHFLSFALLEDFPQALLKIMILSDAPLNIVDLLHAVDGKPQNTLIAVVLLLLADLVVILASLLDLVQLSAQFPDHLQLLLALVLLLQNVVLQIRIELMHLVG